MSAPRKNFSTILRYNHVTASKCMGNSTKKLSLEYVLEKCRLLPDSENYDFDNVVYTNIRTPLTVLCKLHGKFEIYVTGLENQHGCPICDIIVSRHKRHLSLDHYIIAASELHHNKYDYSALNALNFIDKKIPVICKTHGQFSIRKSAHISPSQMYGCQQCGNCRSIGEERISTFLRNNEIEYISQAQFSWALSINDKMPLRFDFYLPKFNMLIEFDGVHHFKPSRYGGQSEESAELQHKRTKLYDSIKVCNAIVKGMQIIRISYLRIKEIDQILTYELLVGPKLTDTLTDFEKDVKLYWH